MDIELRGARRRWGDNVALDGVDLTITSGERVALLGPSGSGKTTLLRLLAGAVRPSSGSVSIDGRDLDSLGARELRDHRRRCALLSQTQHCVNELTVHANVISGLVAQWPWYRTLLSTLWPLEQARVAELLAALGIEDRQFDSAADLSGGQKQRVAIARALVSSPDTLLLDEPTSALDPETAGEALSVILGRAGKNTIVLISTHRASEVREHVDRFIGLRDGAVELDCPRADVGADELEALYAGSSELT